MAKVVEFYPTKQGRPYSLPLVYIPAGTITPAMLAASLKQLFNLTRGVYGTATYGRSRYGIRPGIYGVDKYGSCHYN